MTETKIAVFDLDRTITRGDTFLPFLQSLSKRRLARGLTGALPYMALGLSNREHRDRAKKALIRSTFAGRSTEEVQAAAISFAQRVVPGGLISPIIDCIEKHQNSGHRIIVASASPSVLVLPIAELLDIEHIIATELEIEHGLYTGHLVGANNRGNEKQRRVLAELEQPPDYAYGNLPDDRPLLSTADQAFVVKNGTIASFAQSSP